MRDAKEYFDDIANLKAAPDMLKLAEHILQSKAADFDPSQFVDHYEDAVVKMLKRKQAGLPVSREHATPRPQNVVNLMDALRRFIAGKKPHRHRRRRDASALRDRARCCCPFRAKRAHLPVRRSSRPTGDTVKR
jgi:DNA end-binding protein Ku